MLRLRDQGTLKSLDNLVFGNGALLGSQYGTLPYSAGEKAITVRHLLTHTTGWQSEGVLWDNAYGVNHAAILSWQLDHVPMTTAPGANYQFQNIDFITAGRKPREVRYYQSGGGDPYVTISPKRMDASGGWIAKSSG